MNQYTFDGCGINGPDEFKTQVLTITRPEQRNNPEVVAFCKKAAAAEEMFDALRRASLDLRSIIDHNMKPGNKRTVSKAMLKGLSHHYAAACRAINKANQ